MSGECDKCNEHMLDCKCLDEQKFELALTFLSRGLNLLHDLGYDFPEKIDFKKKVENEH